MPFELSHIVPWGRSFFEYGLMFRLSEADLEKRILGCGDGPAAFNAELARRGGRVVSVDPLYRFGAQQIRARIDEVAGEVLEQTRKSADRFVWTSIPSVDALGELRMNAMGAFLADYEQGRRKGRYMAGELPRLPFADGAFELALCSHLLFLYEDHRDEAFHIESMREMLRVAGEVRVFPLLTLGAQKSRFVEPLRETMEAQGLSATVEKVDYEFQKGGNEMLRVR